jgi:hypothetical protein
MKSFVVAISCLLVAAPALAQSSVGSVSGGAAELSTQNDTPESTGESSARNADGERRICRRVETGSTSRMSSRKVCRTAEEWREARRAR